MRIRGVIMKFMEWNIHGMGGYGNYIIPVKMIINTIIDINPDVIVLLEFIEFANGISDLNYSLNKLGYNIFSTKYKSGKNGVLIAIKKDFKAQFIKEDTEYLEIEVEIENERVSVIGMRILTEGEYKKFNKRKNLLESHLDKIKNEKKKFILLFDANNGAIQNEANKDFQYVNGERKYYNYQYIWRQVEDCYKWSLITPDKGGAYVNGKYSVITGKHVPENYHTKEDHIISSFNENNFSNVDYYWKFVNSANGYEHRTFKDYISDIIGLPDHGIIIADFDLKKSIENYDVNIN